MAKAKVAFQILPKGTRLTTLERSKYNKQLAQELSVSAKRDVSGFLGDPSDVKNLRKLIQGKSGSSSAETSRKLVKALGQFDEGTFSISRRFAFTEMGRARRKSFQRELRSVQKRIAKLGPEPSFGASKINGKRQKITQSDVDAFNKQRTKLKKRLREIRRTEKLTRQSVRTKSFKDLFENELNVIERQEFYDANEKLFQTWGRYKTGKKKEEAWDEIRRNWQGLQFG